MASHFLNLGSGDYLGGYLSRDESLVQAVRREAMEESGWEIDNIKLFRIIYNPNRPNEDKQNVDIVFTSKAIKQINTSGEEVKELK